MRSTLSFMLLLVAQQTFSQTNTAAAYRKHLMDSIKNVYFTEAAIRNPLLRQTMVSTDIVSGAATDSKLYGNKIFNSKVKQVRTTALINMPLKSWGNNSLSASFSFFQQHFNFSEVTTYQSNINNLEGKNVNKFTGGLTLSFNRRDSIFGRPVIYTASVTGTTNKFSTMQRVNFLGGFLLALKQTATTSYSVGILLNIDNSVNVPVVPVFVYWHKFSNSLELNAFLPQLINVRKTFSKTTWATVGTKLSGAVSFFRFNETVIPRDAIFSSLELKTGLGIEHRIGKKLIAGANAGMFTPFQSRLFEKGELSNNFFLSNKIQSSPYLTFTVSLLPFL